ncbi:MAG: response regulator [Hydrogenophilaceae bacterium]|nr:response regulator [Hydrogenophilaceae bacterium]
MLGFKDYPIQKKLRLAIMLACAVLVGLFAAASLVKDITSAKAGLEEKFASLAAVLTNNLAPAVVFEDSAAADQALATLHKETHVLYAAIYTQSGRRFADYLGAAPRARTGSIAAEMAAVSSESLAACPYTRFSLDRLMLCRTIELKGEPVGKLLLVSSLAPLYTQMLSVLLISLVVLVTALILALLISHPLASALASPIVRLTETVHRVSTTHDYGTRAVKESDDELGLLTDGFNDMLRQLQQRDASLRQYREELERLVAERTAELERTVAALKEAKERAESASRAKSEFLSSMSHELRTPLNAVLGFAQLIELDPQLDPEHQENIREIARAGNHLLALISDVIDLAKIEAGRLDIPLSAVPVAKLIEECRSLVQPLARERGISLDFEVGDCASLAVLANFTRLRQIVLNLTSNAIKYNRANGSVQVRCQTPAPDRLRICVEDTGPGISMERQRELFEAFNRLGAEMGPVEGTGIGLVITKRLTEMMGGQIGVESTVGKGSTFWVEFALTQATPEPAARPAAQPRPGTAEPAGRRAGTLLYVEDNAINMRLVEKALANHWPELKLLTADSGEAALALLEHERPDAILLDIGLPGLDGYQVLQRIRAIGALRDTPVIALTASAMADDLKRGELAGFSAYLTKPFHIDHLLRTLGDFVRPKTA